MLRRLFGLWPSWKQISLDINQISLERNNQLGKVEKALENIKKALGNTARSNEDEVTKRVDQYLRDTQQKINGVFFQYPILANNGVCIAEIDGLIFLPEKAIVIQVKAKVDVDAINQV